MKIPVKPRRQDVLHDLRLAQDPRRLTGDRLRGSTNRRVP
jgi:hypothetical protein